MDGDSEKMIFKRIGHKILAVVGIAVTLGLVATAWFYTSHQEEAVLAQNERTMHKLTESVIQGLQSVMLAGYADIAQSFADRLSKVPEVDDFRILRVTGQEAFRDNKTIDEVNRRRGEETFAPRDKEESIIVLRADEVHLKRAVETREPVSYYETDAKGERRLTFIAPILNNEPCYKCHGRANPVRGVLKLTTSLAPVERDILAARQQSLVVLGTALMGTLLLTGYMLGRSIVRPIEKVTSAMLRASSGDLDQRVPVKGGDELAQMAGSFNTMTKELQRTYEGLQHEQDKLTTIIHSAREAIIVTDAADHIVLVNPAAAELLEKPTARIIEDGFLNIVDDPSVVEAWLDREDSSTAEIYAYKQRIFSVYAARIHNEKGDLVGTAALLRDITEEKRLEAELRRLSTTDGLTSLFNRRHLDESLQKELDRARRYPGHLSVLMFDVDHFKKFNDTHGHDQGDRVLQSVAKTLRGALRNQDYPCRYGGEEFVAILPNTPKTGAYAVAERLRLDIEAMVVDGLKVTISIGVAEYPDFDVEDQAQLIEAADAALYHAKRDGRNRTCVAEPQPPAGATQTVAGDDNTTAAPASSDPNSRPS